MNITISEIRIRKRTVTEWLVAIVFFLPFVQGLLSEFIGFPDEIKFFADVAVIFLLMKIASLGNLHKFCQLSHQFQYS